MENAISAYCRRIGYGGDPAPSLQTLRGLHEAHVGAIPFENLDAFLNRPGPLDPDSLFRKLVASRRGGYCYEQNGLFKHVLETLGYRVTGLAARVRFGSTAVRPRTHMLLLVKTEAGRYIADVGFGGIGLLEPIPLIAGREFEFPLVSFRLRNEGPAWLLQAKRHGLDGSGWTDLYVFSLEPQEPPDYEMAHYFTSNHPQSIFVLGLTAQLVRREERLFLRNRTLSIHRPDGGETLILGSEPELISALRDRFHLALPEGASLSRLFE